MITKTFLLLISFLCLKHKTKNISDKIEVIDKVIKPNLYNLILNPSIINKNIEGSLELHFKTLKSINQIELNQFDIKIKSCVITKNLITIKCLDIQYNNYNMRIKIDLSQYLELSTEYILKLSFTSHFSENMDGAYLNKDVDYNDNVYYYISTQFEPYGARKVFPCIDEPGVKSKFKLTIIFNRNYKDVYSNMPIIKQLLIENDKRQTEFEVTPIMSTYLLAFTIGNFDKLNKSYNKLSYSVITPLKRSSDGYLALETAQKLLNAMEDMFKIKYPLSKVDLISVKSLAANAMENWGLITFKESRILIDNSSSLNDKLMASDLISHELSHQWFGNLVTMEWWNDLWLNETMATFMGHFVTDQIYPELQMYDNIYRYSMNEAVRMDSALSTHPIDVKLLKVQYVMEIFDAISYRKGESVMRNFFHYIGYDNFIGGLKNYLNKYKYSNATKLDLFAEWEAIVGNDFTSKIKTWIDHKGIPLLTVNEAKEGKVLISISRFTYLDENMMKDDNEIQPTPNWFIPLYYCTSGNSGVLVELNDVETIVDYKNYIHLNYNARSFVRIRYSESLMNKLLQKETFSMLNISEIHQILSDNMALFENGTFKLDYYLKIIINILDLSNASQKISIISFIQQDISKITNLIQNNDVREYLYKKFYKYIKNYLNELTIGEIGNSMIIQENYDNSTNLYFKFYKFIKANKSIDKYYRKIMKKIFENKSNNINKIDIRNSFNLHAYNIKNTSDLNKYFEYYSKLNKSIYKSYVASSYGYINSKFRRTILDKIYNSTPEDLVKAVEGIIQDNLSFEANKIYFIQNCIKISKNLHIFTLKSVLTLTYMYSYDIEDYNQLINNLDKNLMINIQGTLKNIKERIYINQSMKQNLKKYEELDTWYMIFDAELN